MKIISKNEHPSYRSVYGDLFDNIDNYISGGNAGCSIVVPHVCNNINLFGAGFAGAVSKHYPIVKENFQLLGNKAVLGHTQFVSVYKDKKFGHELIFANMIAQNGLSNHNNRRPINYAALCRCMISVSLHVRQKNESESKIQIHAPKFGSGLAGGNWLFIQDLITDIWKDLSVVIYTNDTGSNLNKRQRKQ